jgi:hypothetical protein
MFVILAQLPNKLYLKIADPQISVDKDTFLSVCNAISVIK